MKIFFKHAKDKSTVIRSFKVALVVGSILAFINHYMAFLTCTFTSKQLFQIFLTYIVPYLVSTYGSASLARDLEINKTKIKSEFN